MLRLSNRTGDQGGLPRFQQCFRSARFSVPQITQNIKPHALCHYYRGSERRTKHTGLFWPPVSGKQTIPSHPEGAGDHSDSIDLSSDATHATRLQKMRTCDLLSMAFQFYTVNL
jgi:hypothetical protein